MAQQFDELGAAAAARDRAVEPDDRDPTRGEGPGWPGEKPAER
jgi:hypothetical protein